MMTQKSLKGIQPGIIKILEDGRKIFEDMIKGMSDFWILDNVVARNLFKVFFYLPLRSWFQIPFMSNFSDLGHSLEKTVVTNGYRVQVKIYRYRPPFSATCPIPSSLTLILVTVWSLVFINYFRWIRWRRRDVWANVAPLNRSHQTTTKTTRWSLGPRFGFVFQKAEGKSEGDAG